MLVARLVQSADAHANCRSVAARIAATRRGLGSSAIVLCMLAQRGIRISVLRSLPSDYDLATWPPSSVTCRNAELAKERGYEEQRRAAQTAPRHSAAELRLPNGIPLLISPGLPGVSLQLDQARLEPARALELFALAFIFVMVFSFFHHAWSMAQAGRAGDPRLPWLSWR